MTPEEARAELDASTLRPEDASAEAHALAGDNKALGDWVKQRTVFDEQVAGALAGIPVPADLKTKIMAGSLQPEPVKKRPLFLLPVMLAAAAVIAVGMTWMWLADDSRMTASDRQALAMVNAIDSHAVKLDHFSSNLPQLKHLLAEAGSPQPGGLPAGFEKMRSLGCKMFQVDGQPASVICFEIKPGYEAHLVIMPADVSQHGDGGSPEFTRNGEWHIAAWNGAGTRYLVATKAHQNDLRELFAGRWNPAVVPIA